MTNEFKVKKGLIVDGGGNFTGGIYQPVYGDNTGLLAHIGFTDIGSDQTQYDKSGNNNNAVADLGAIPVVSATGGPHGGAVGVFDGVDDFYRTGQLLSGAQSTFTFESFFNPTSNHDGWMVTHNAVDHFTLLGYTSAGKVIFQIQWADTTTTDLFSDVIPFGNWYHAVGTYDGTTAKLYVDGKLVDSTAVTKTTDFTTNFLGFDFGGTNYVSTYFYGGITDIKVYNRALHEDEIRVPYLRSGDSVIKSNDLKLIDSSNNILFDIEGIAASFLRSNDFRVNDATRNRLLIDSADTKLYSPDGTGVIELDDNIHLMQNSGTRMLIEDTQTEIYSPSATSFLTVKNNEVSFYDSTRGLM